MSTVGQTARFFEHHRKKNALFLYVLHELKEQQLLRDSPCYTLVSILDTESISF